MPPPPASMMWKCSAMVSSSKPWSKPISCTSSPVRASITSKAKRPMALRNGLPVEFLSTLQRISMPATSWPSEPSAMKSLLAFFLSSTSCSSLLR